MAEMEKLVAEAIGRNAEVLSSYTHFKGEHERNTRLFPVDLRSRTGQGLWIKLTNWQADVDGFVDRDSTRRGRITLDFMVAPFFEHVKNTDNERSVRLNFAGIWLVSDF